MAAMLRDSVVVVAVAVAVIRTRPRAIPLAMITKRKFLNLLTEVEPETSQKPALDYGKLAVQGPARTQARFFYCVTHGLL